MLAVPECSLSGAEPAPSVDVYKMGITPKPVMGGSGAVRRPPSKRVTGRGVEPWFGPAESALKGGALLHITLCFH